MDSTDSTDAPVTTAPRLGRYRIDPGRSAVTFRTRALFGLLPVRGTFALRGGTVDVAEPLAESAVRADVDAASLRTGNARRDAHVRSARFLDTSRHPLVTFAAGQADAATATVSGTLTVRATTRPVRLTVTRLAPSADGFTARATTRIDRTAFGVTAAPGTAGRHLDLTLEIRCVRA